MPLQYVGAAMRFSRVSQETLHLLGFLLELLTLVQ